MPNKITNHWSVGNYTTVYPEYHYSITFDTNTQTAKVVYGVYKPEDNDNCQDGRYAPHAKMCNTGNIGVCLCAMFGASEKHITNTKYPITRQQAELMFELNAELCIKYNIKIDEVQTHFERDRKLGSKKDGKIDIIYMACYPEVSRMEVGNFIRQKTQWYINKKKKGEIAIKYVK